MRVAIVHYWLLGMRGGESVVESLCRMLPEADIFTLFYDPSRVSETIRSHKVTASYLNPLRRLYRSLLPFMPSALESFDLRGYDLVISSESGPAKGVITQAATRHVCYCHTPMRYLWELYPAYLADWTHSGLQRLLMRPLTRNLRLWDFASAARVDRFVANSENVRRRIWKTYRRDSKVVHPPVAVETFHHRPPADYFLTVSELVSYKHLDYAIRHFSQTGRKLRVAGDGPEYRNLKRQAGGSVEFCGRVSAADLRELYASSRALVVPGEEDFGITMIEALASGKPVIALGRGGACEILADGLGVRQDSFRERIPRKPAQSRLDSSFDEDFDGATSSKAPLRGLVHGKPAQGRLDSSFDEDFDGAASSQAPLHGLVHGKPAQGRFDSSFDEDFDGATSNQAPLRGQLHQDPNRGVLYSAPTAEDLEDALTRFEILEAEFHPKQLQRWAGHFSEAHFRENMQRILTAPDPVAEPVPAPFA